MAVLGQAVAGVAELGRLAVPLAREARLGVGRRTVSCVPPPLAAPVDVGVAAATGGRWRIALALFDRPQALERGGRLDERAVEGEVLAAEQLVRRGLGTDRREEGLGDRGGEQAVAVLRERDRMPDRLVRRQADEPAQEQVVAQLLAEPALGGDGVEDLHELGAQQVLGGDRGAAARGVEDLEAGLHLGEGDVDEGADGAQGVVGRHDVLERGHDDEAGLPLFVAAHLTHLQLACLAQ